MSVHTCDGSLSQLVNDGFDSLIPHSHFSICSAIPRFSLGEVFLHLIFTHNIFKAPGSGIYRQAQGFSMGTNCVPA